MSGYQLGIGMSARSHLGFTRLSQPRADLEPYLARVERRQSPVEQISPLDEEDRMTQFIARDTRRRQATRVEPTMRQSFGTPTQRTSARSSTRLIAAGLVETTGRALTLSEPGKLLYDLVTLAFYPQARARWLYAAPRRASAIGRPGSSTTSR